jgi:hypothetical protein
LTILNTKTVQVLISLLPYLKPEEMALFFRRIFDFLRGSDLWLLTNQRLLLVKKEVLKEIPLLEPGELVIYHDTGEVQFSGNVHLLTTQRVIVLDIGAKDYLLESIPLNKITKVDINIIGKRGIHAITYGLKIDVAENEQPIEIIHGGINTNGINQSSLSKTEQQQINERYARKICEVTGLNFAIPQMRVGSSGFTVITFYSKSDLVWPARCSACCRNVDGLVFDKYAVDNPWLATYIIGFGLLPRITYSIPYCPDCYQVRFVEGKENRAVQEGWSKYDGARVELLFENQDYAIDFIQTNSR